MIIIIIIIIIREDLVTKEREGKKGKLEMQAR